MNAAIYARVSTAEQREEGTSLDTQRDQCLAKAAELGWTVPQENVVVEEWTGKDLQRPGLQRLSDLAHSHQIQGIVIYTLDRLYRPENDGDEWRVFEVLQAFTEAGVEVAWVDPSIPSSGPLASIFTFLDAWRAGRERRAIVERTSRGRLEKARRGKVISSSAAPYGYRYDSDTSSLIVHEEEAKIVRLMFFMYTHENLSILKVADHLNRTGIAKPRGGNKWRSSGVGRILRNEVYVGTLWQNKWKAGSDRTGDKKTRTTLRPRSEWIKTDAPMIVPHDLFDPAQHRLEENLRFARRNTKREYLLSGLIKHSCGSRMRARTNKGDTYYTCYRSEASKAPIDDNGEPQRCSSRWVRGAQIERATWDTVTGLLRDPDRLVQEVKKLAQPDSESRQIIVEEMSRLKVKASKLPVEEGKLVEGYRKGLYADFMMREQMQSIKSEREAIQHRVGELEGRLSRIDRAQDYAWQAEAFARRISVGLDNMGFQERRELLRLVVDEIVYDDGDLTINTIIPTVPLHPVPRELEWG